ISAMFTPFSCAILRTRGEERWRIRSSIDSTRPADEGDGTGAAGGGGAGAGLAGGGGGGGGAAGARRPPGAEARRGGGGQAAAAVRERGRSGRLRERARRPAAALRPLRWSRRPC